jgi:hypothetical protein
VGVSGAVHRRVFGLDAPELRKELQPGLLFDYHCDDLDLSPDRRHGSTSSGCRHGMFGHRFAGHVCHLGFSRAVHRRGFGLDAAELRKELQPGLLSDADAVQLCSLAVGKLLGLLRQRLPDPICGLQWQQRHYCRQLIVCQLWCYASDLPSLRPANMCRNCDSSRASDGTSDHRRALYGIRRVLDEWGERCDLVFTSDGPLADNAPNQPRRAERPRTAVPRPRESDTAIEC